MKTFFQLLCDYQRLKHELKATFIKLKSELDIYVYEKKISIWNTNQSKQQ